MATKEDYMVLGFDTRDPEQKEALVKRLAEEQMAGKSMKEALQMPEYQLEQVYGLAYGKYQQGSYEKALELFQYLLMFENFNHRYLLGSAATMDKMGDLAGAATAYQLASYADPFDPVAFFHAGKCYAKLGEVDQAVVGLEMAIHAGSKDPKYAELVTRARLMKETLEARG